MNPDKATKTGKREIALIGLALWFAVTVRIFFFTEASDVAQFEAAFNGLTLVIVPAGLAVFGFHGVQKALEEKIERPKYRPQEPTGGENGPTFG